MARKLHFRQLLVLILAVLYDVPQKEISARSKISWSSVSKYLQGRKRDIPEEILEKLLAAIPCSPAAVLAVTSCLEALDGLDQAGDLSDADLEEIEKGMLVASRAIRDALVQGIRRARSKPVPGYPLPADLAAHRFRAGEQLERLKTIPAEHRGEVVRQAVEFQTWALCERMCEESARQAARNVEDSLAWARLSQEVARLVEEPEGWGHRLQGYALAHVANAMRVGGELTTAETILGEAKRLWEGGTDPERVLDPGRLLDLEACLYRAQRRFNEALDMLDKAVEISHTPERALINKAFTFEVMGDYTRAAGVLRQAAPLVEARGERRIHNILRLNLATNFCHLSQFHEALALIKQVRPHVIELGDRIDSIRILWLEGRIAAGLSRSTEALVLFNEAKRQFIKESMAYDVALIVLEEAIVLLGQGRTSEVQALAQELVVVFESHGVHREAQVALHIFQEAAIRENVTSGLARDIFSYLVQARHDKTLRFSSP